MNLAENHAKDRTPETLDGLLKELAARQPHERALADPSDRRLFTDGAPRRLTWAVLDREVDRLAAGLRALDLEPSAVVALQIPNIAESVIALLAVLRAGYVASPLPLVWGRKEIAAALNRLDIKAAILVCRSGPFRPASSFRDAAVDAHLVRFLLAYGDGAPDGVISLDQRLEEMAAGDRGPQDRGCNGDATAIATWDAGGDVITPVHRTHSELIAAGAAHAEEIRLGERDVIATTLLGFSLAGLATGLVTSLISGTQLVLHQPFDSKTLSAALVAESASHVVLPGPAIAALLDSGRLRGHAIRSVSAVWRETEKPDDIVSFGGPEIIDVRSFGEIGLVASVRTCMAV